jgi:hypothetical protein
MGISVLTGGTFTFTASATGIDRNSGATVYVSSTLQVTITPPPVKDGIRVVGGYKGCIRPLQGETATIMLKSPLSGAFSVGIYTMRGYLVYSTSRYCTANVADVFTWSCRNASGAIVPAGTYVIFARALCYKVGRNYRASFVVMR